MRSGDKYQYALISLLLVIGGLFSLFVYRELFPEYRNYQKAYVAVEEFRSNYTGESPAPFKSGVKQVVIPRDDKGPEVIDRCTSCHVAMKLEHFSDTKVAKDINGEIVLDESGTPKKVENDLYVWGKIDQEIAQLRDEEKNRELESSGRESEVKRRLARAEELEALKVFDGGGHHEYDMTKVLAMHPLIGKETRPFQYHSMEEFGCTSCHGGNGRGLTTATAHGPLFDGDYHAESHGPEPEFIEPDPKNDPKFSKVFNSKPGHELLFQTTPLLVGDLIEAKCVQCHQSSSKELDSAISKVGNIGERKEGEKSAIAASVAADREALIALITTKRELKQLGYSKTIESVYRGLQDLSLTDQEQRSLRGKLSYLSAKYAQVDGGSLSPAELSKKLYLLIEEEAIAIVGSSEALATIELESGRSGDFNRAIDQFVQESLSSDRATGSLARKLQKISSFSDAKRQLQEVESNLRDLASNQNISEALSSDIDWMTADYERGKKLFFSNGCYSCHRITGLARGGVGPELTLEGLAYPWFVKESIQWPQADLKSSTMPNFKIDHEELEDLMAFLMAQRGEDKTVSQYDSSVTVSAWEAGRKLEYEKEVPPEKIKDVENSMMIFTTEGCASCHRLKGFESNVGYVVEKENPDFLTLHKEKEWFKGIFPEEITGSKIASNITENWDEIKRRTAVEDRVDQMLEKIDQQHPQLLESFYENFKFALRAKNSEFEKEETPFSLQEWNEMVYLVMKLYIQEYGVGRLIGPKLHWSGIYRSDEWLIQHFRKPTAHSPKSLMPVLPFDDTKFFALTHMLNVLGKKNRDEVRQIWEERGFNPELAYDIHCSSCHGKNLQGNGPLTEWIYPIPKNLRNATFLRNYTKERVVNSLRHGVNGTPMPAWGTVAEDKREADSVPVLLNSEIDQLVNWMFNSLPGSRVIQGEEDVLKWQYDPEDVLKEIDQEGDSLEEEDSNLSALLELFADHPNGEGLYASLDTPKVENLSVDEVFEVRALPQNSVQKEGYFIKRKFYTEENLARGAELFKENCSVCHGSEGAGNGLRAETMVDAKPRMLNNFHWLEMKDDLHLLRSIKYGVLGTSMTPWGDYTSSLQRMQLVMFIRSLSEEKILNGRFEKSLYQGFDLPILSLNEARAKRSGLIESAREKYEQAKRENRREKSLLLEGKGSTAAASSAYEKELALLGKLNEVMRGDQLIGQMIQSLEEEQTLYREIGASFISRGEDRSILDSIFDLIEINGKRFLFSNSQLSYQFDRSTKKRGEELKGVIENYLNSQLKKIEKRKEILRGGLVSIDKEQELGKIATRKRSLIQLKALLLSGTKKAAGLRENQRKIYDQFVSR